MLATSSRVQYPVFAVVPDDVPEVISTDPSVEPSASAEENRSNWEPTMSTMAKLPLRGAGASADVSPTLFPPDSVDIAVVPNRVQEVIHIDKGVEPGVTAEQKKSGWKSTALATAKLLLRGVGNSADAFPPLKSVAGGLCFILENCEVRHPPARATRDTHRSLRGRRRIGKQ